jgi:hypothetical protein
VPTLPANGNLGLLGGCRLTAEPYCIAVESIEMRTVMNRGLRSLMVVALIAGAGHDALARQEPGQPARNAPFLAQTEPHPAPRVTMGDAMGKVQREAGGRVINAQEARREGHDGYRIKVLSASGEVRVFFVDARSGEMRQE